MSQSGDGPTSDTQRVPQRAEAVMRACKDTPSPRARVADATRSCEEHAPPLAQRGFLTPLPATLQVVSPVMRQARQGATGQPVDPNTRYQPRRRCHAGMVQRWVVVYAQAALDRAEATLKHAPHRAHAAMTKQLLHLQAPRLGAPEAAHDAPRSVGSALAVSPR